MYDCDVAYIGPIGIWILWFVGNTKPRSISLFVFCIHVVTIEIQNILFPGACMGDRCRSKDFGLQEKKGLISHFDLQCSH